MALGRRVGGVLYRAPVVLVLNTRRRVTYPNLVDPSVPRAVDY